MVLSLGTLAYGVWGEKTLRKARGHAAVLAPDHVSTHAPWLAPARASALVTVHVTADGPTHAPTFAYVQAPAHVSNHSIAANAKNIWTITKSKKKQNSIESGEKSEYSGKRRLLPLLKK